VTLAGIEAGMKRRGGWTVAWAQITGVHHRVCEDQHAHHFTKKENPGGLCLALADGVGGGARGEVAAEALARHCVDVPGELLGKPAALAQWMRLAEGQVQLRLREVTFSPGAATLAAAWLDDGGIGYFTRVGDCRLYLCRAGEVSALTADQTYAQVGETPPPGVPDNAPARMIGTGCAGDIELQKIALFPGEGLLLCSDGLHNGLDEKKIAEIIRDKGSQLEHVCAALADAAREAGSEDDITVLIAQHSSDTSEYWWRCWIDFVDLVRKSWIKR
jgi:protein phosphatase